MDDPLKRVKAQAAKRLKEIMLEYFRELQERVVREATRNV